MIYVCVVFGGLLLSFYLLLFRNFRKGWLQTEDYIPDWREQPSTGFSILVPARNEETNLYGCLLDLADQSYPADLFEVIIIDDHSEDRTAEIAQQFCAGHSHFRYLHLSDFLKENKTPAHKKAAIAAGISQSRFDWIVTTDADCRRGKDWLRTLSAFIQEKKPLLVSAPVAFSYENTFLQRAQAIEFSGLVGIGAATLNTGRPTMCNGANLAYSRQAFMEAGGFEGIDHIASGDDELLMHKIHERRPDGIMFLKNKDAMVYTNPCLSLTELMQQRRRWVSKSRAYKRKSITLILMAAYLFNLVILACFIGVFFNLSFLIIGLIMLSGKLLAESTFLKPVTAWISDENLMKLFLPASLLHIPYVLFIGIYGNFGRYRWKGRRLS